MPMRADILPDDASCPFKTTAATPIAMMHMNENPMRAPEKLPIAFFFAISLKNYICMISFIISRIHLLKLSTRPTNPPLSHLEPALHDILTAHILEFPHAEVLYE